MNFATRYERSRQRVASLSPAVASRTINPDAARLRLKQMRAGIAHAYTKRTTQQ